MQYLHSYVFKLHTDRQSFKFWRLSLLKHDKLNKYKKNINPNIIAFKNHFKALV